MTATLDVPVPSQNGSGTSDALAGAQRAAKNLTAGRRKFLNRTARRHLTRTMLGKDWSKEGVKELKRLLPRPQDESQSIGLERRNTTPGQDPYDLLEWEKVDIELKNWRDGTVSFYQAGVEKPVQMTLNAAIIMASKYFRGRADSPEREQSFRDLIDRITDAIVDFGWERGYFADQAERDTLAAEFKFYCASQMMAPNSPVWFNIGVKDLNSGELVPQQGSACFILHVEDSRVSLSRWVEDEASIFYGGSGSGVNLSNVRSSLEGLSRGGMASGPIPYALGADMMSGAIKSGGTTRRAAKMLVMNDSHPDIVEFVNLKRKAEDFLRAARGMGFDVDIDGSESGYVASQNANNSFRASDAFMKAVEKDEDWHLRAVTTGEVVKTVRARDLMRQIAQASWECADPGMQFDDTVNDMHTLANINRITASNPCSEYMSEDNSACNLLSINLLKFLGDDGAFDVDGFKHAVQVAITYMEILVGYADYPTEAVAINANKHRQLGIGYANLGALLMSLGYAYDSDEGRAWAGAITALLTGEAYATSAKIAARMGAFEDCDAPMLRVLEKHQAFAGQIDGAKVPGYLLEAAQDSWQRAVDGCRSGGVRNSQASVLAPTGTIGLLMDCDTTGVEPALGLMTFKKLVGGGSMKFAVQVLPRGLRARGYDDQMVKAIVEHVEKNEGSILGAPGIHNGDLAVFATSMGDNPISYMGHLRMMAAAQRFISGAISKTVNLPQEITVEELEQLHIEAWRLGIKAIAVYRDNCKAAQPLTTGSQAGRPGLMWLLERATQDLNNEEFLAALAALFHGRFNPKHDFEPDETGKRHLPLLRPAVIYKQEITDANGTLHDHYVTWGLGQDGKPLEEFIVAALAGSAYRGMLDMKGQTQSEAFKRGQTISDYVSRNLFQSYEPSGFTPDPDIPTVQSHQDGLARLASVLWESPDVQLERGVMTREAKKLKAASLGYDTAPVPVVQQEVDSKPAKANGNGSKKSTGRVLECTKCHSSNIQDGPCPTCLDCGEQLKGCSA